MLSEVTVEDCQRFMDAINTGREAVGLDRIEKLEFDSSEPGSSSNCLSARHLFCAIPNTRGVVASTEAYLFDGDFARRLGDALGTHSDGEIVLIPDSILRVTEIFDGCIDDDARDAAEEFQALRTVMVEAGLVD